MTSNNNEVPLHFSLQRRRRTGELQGTLETLLFKISSCFMTCKGGDVQLRQDVQPGEAVDSFTTDEILWITTQHVIPS